MDRIKLLMLNYEFPPIGGGAGMASYNLLKEFACNESIEIDMLTSGASPGLSVEKFADNINIHKVGISKGDLHYWKRSEVIDWLFKAHSKHRNLLARNNYDLAHAFFGFPTGFLPWTTASKLPYMISLRGSDVPGCNSRLALEYKIFGPLFRSIWKNASSLVTCSKGLSERARRFAPDLNFEIIPNGVDSKAFESLRQRRLSTPLKLITAGRLSSTKRIDTLIEAVNELTERGIDVEFTIAGGGALKESLQSLAVQKKIGNKITFAGRLQADQMPQFYHNGHILLSASIQEGMSNAMLEAIASGLPIIAARCEGVDELIGSNGIVLDDATPAAFADKITEFLDDPGLYASMSAAALERSAQFTWSSVAESYLELYRKVISQKGLVK